ncbi:MAG TPA: FmdB family zinc ribbon protein [Ktedonobacteraceae bacterium]|nr:FmdB family zinc ribbon protein [Ktedonobacteraceae bacterium]
MPTYEYLCKSCGHRFEIWQRMSDEPLAVCSECGADIRRVVFPAGIVFKGSGFYKTDHANGSAHAEAGHAAKSEEGTSSETKKMEGSESKSSESSKSGADSSTSKPSESKVAAETK